MNPYRVLAKAPAPLSPETVPRSPWIKKVREWLVSWRWPLYYATMVLLGWFHDVILRAFGLHHP